MPLNSTAELPFGVCPVKKVGVPEAVATLQDETVDPLAKPSELASKLRINDPCAKPEIDRVANTLISPIKNFLFKSSEIAPDLLVDLFNIFLIVRLIITQALQYMRQSK